MSAATRRMIMAFVTLRWRLLRGAIRHGGTEQVGAIIATVASVLFGLGLGAAAAIGGRTSDHPGDLVVIFCSVLLLAVLGFGIVAGIAQPIDPRVIAAEPLSSNGRSIGLLAASAAGPPGLAGGLIGMGVAIGMVRSLASAPIVVLAVGAWLGSLLLIARTSTNLLALLISRLPRFGQVAVGSFGLLFYGLFQFVPAAIGELDAAQRGRLADALAWSPPGQIGRAMDAAPGSPGVALAHLVAGAAWLPLLAAAFLRSAERLSVATRHAGSLDSEAATRSPIARRARQACGDGATGAIAWRALLTRFRTPRTLLETFTGAGVGLAAVLAPALLRDTAGSGAVLVGGAVQLAVLFMSGNSLGVDGPPLTYELLSGADADVLVRGKARSVAIVAAPLAVVGPVAAAALTGEWRFLAAGFGVGTGALLAGTGAAMVQSALVPIAVPDSDNPFASGESGKGIVAALLLAVVLAGLALATLPVALALLWATDRGNTALVTVFGAATVGVGWLVMQAGIRLAVRRLRGRDPEFVNAITPVR